MTEQAATEELKHRVEARRKELEAKLEHTRADAAAKQDETKEQVQTKLDELNNLLSEGWENMKEGTARQLNDWLKSN